MAWKARLKDPIVAAGDHVVATFDYFDDADPATTLGTQTFAFDPTSVAADMQAQVQSRGKELRAATVRATALAAQFPPVTTVINIP
jgi:hypothetical protein